MVEYIVRVTDGSSFADIEVASDSLIDACGHAVDRVINFDEIMCERFETDLTYDTLFVDSVRRKDGGELDVPHQWLSGYQQLVIEADNLRAEVARLKAKCGEADDAQA